ncbi:hypothetical protein MNBD_GAMMA23-183 [hydrothermal vent metagenome]|uniref:CRISPR-associated protein, Cas6-related n=1 Tax=hydrothermal vent metagenome TaxID=652676 RepID=A0A3B0ZSV8_9ZZZZ
MYWSENKDKKAEFIVPDNIVDVVFNIQGKAVPLDNAHALSSAIEQLLPWVAENPQIGIHQIYGAESGNGWLRPENTENEVLYLSRRQKLILRIPKEQLAETQQLTGQTLTVDEYELKIGQSVVRKLSEMNIIFARHVVVNGQEQSEDEFMQACAAQCNALGIEVKKMMCGLERTIQLPGRQLITRGLMLADLEKEDSIKLQENGLGMERKLGCGLFVPQKGIDTANPD